MKITVHVKTKTGQAKIEQTDEDQYKVWLKSAPVKGKANRELVKLLADYFNVTQSSVRVIIGKTAREKLIEISSKT